MQLRSRSNRSGEGTSRQQEIDFDDMECVQISDSDISCYSDEAEDLLSLLEENGEAAFYVDDHTDDDSYSKKRKKVRSKKRKGGSSNAEDVALPADMAKDEDIESEVVGLDSEVEVFPEVREFLRAKRRKKNKKHDPPLLWEVWEEQHERWLDEDMERNSVSEIENEIINRMADPPSDLTMPLLRYQKEWLVWALEQEESAIKGGILADEMGMGKTIQAIALVLAKRQIRLEIGEPNRPSESLTVSPALPEIKCTLVICPVVAVMQWVNEIERFTVKGSTRVLVHHGANRGKNFNQFSEYDFVITTYSIVESEYRRNVMPPKKKCDWCGKLFNPDKLDFHRKYFCGPDAVRTEKQSKQSRKGDKCDPKMMKQKKESTEDISGDLDCRKKMSRHKKYTKKTMQGEDVPVDPMVDNFSADSEQGLLRNRSILHSVKWDRLILDEAHFIKDRRCNTAKAILSLESNYKWALSGTPLQNRVGELYSLVRFLQILPYSYYLCKDCDCRNLDFCSSKQCSFCPHKSMRHFCWWNKYIATPIQSIGSRRGGNRAMHLLRNKILKSIVLRRTKKGRASDLALPPTIISLRRDVLDIREEDYYQSLYNESQAKFNTYVDSGTLLNNYAHIFDLLTRLRQAVDHPYLVVYSKTSALKNGNMSTEDSEKACGICHDPADEAVVASCGHIFCKACLVDFSTDREEVLCPSCSKPLTVDLTTNVKADQISKSAMKGFKRGSILNRVRLDDFQTSTKIEALREEIRFMIEKDGSAKGIVFSQFTSFLDLINFSLQKSGVMCVQLVGSMSMAAREDAISKFIGDPDCKIFLMSLKAGGVALNLTVASHVFLMDPWWNPAVERQAQDRIHRIGQYKPIRIVRFVIENTIEERILKLQEKKQLVFEGTVGGSSDALGKLTEADMKFLFVT